MQTSRMKLNHRLDSNRNVNGKNYRDAYFSMKHKYLGERKKASYWYHAMTRDSKLIIILEHDVNHLTARSKRFVNKRSPKSPVRQGHQNVKRNVTNGKVQKERKP